MKEIKTHNYIKLSTDLNIFPPLTPAHYQKSLPKTFTEDEENSKENIKKKWRKKKKDRNKKDLVYQLGIQVP